MTRVVFVYGNEPYDVYIGRGSCPRTGKYGKYGNQYSHKVGTLARFKVDTIEEAISCYERDTRNNPKLMAQIKIELKDKVLGCWCKTKRNPNAPCHGDVLARIADEE